MRNIDPQPSRGYFANLRALVYVIRAGRRLQSPASFAVTMYFSPRGNLSLPSLIVFTAEAWSSVLGPVFPPDDRSFSCTVLAFLT